jgi:phosphatidylglycerophosphatase A
MKLNFIEKLFGSGFYTGYIPVASGTFASAIALLIYYIPNFEQPYIFYPMIIIFTLWGIKISSKFEKIYGKDPAECTIDEVVGMWISLLFLPKSILISVTAFFLWRLLDIIKPFPAKKLEELKGGLGIMADDVLASIYTCILMNSVVYLFKIL